MIIVRQWGGLGNQMFIDAYVESLINLGRTVKVDLSYFQYFNKTYELKDIFGIERNIATRDECRKFGMFQLDKPHRVLRKTLYPLFVKPNHFIIKGNKNHVFLKHMIEIEEGYVEGYFQSSDYFNTIKDKIRSNFIFPPLDDENCRISELIKSTNSVSIHVRRGDYLKQDSSYNVCGLNYFKNAINYIEKHISQPTFFVFSNDIDWCKNHLGNNKEFVYVNHNIGKNSFRDMQLMSLCKHNIIANSTFSWWGAWLNSYKEKIVCAPEFWFLPDFSGDVIPNTWIKISVK